MESKVGAGSFFILSLPFSNQPMMKPPPSVLSTSHRDNTTEGTPSLRFNHRMSIQSAMAREQPTPEEDDASSTANNNDSEFLSNHYR